ncbi:SIS domain-containing protein [Acidobacterium sp. S8]|uniref:SIS domain-containing protein n=1 Tax=Acidobacterium sp. S8 TaxID=1641854 RepID=UPI00131C0A3C|nr:SIS domain-containing protein [Acidobacterium sp. S8]
MQDALSALLILPDSEKTARGLTDTPHEIQQQPETWRGTLRRLDAAADRIREFLQDCGVAPGSQTPPNVILAGAGTSDYIGRTLTRLLSLKWRTNVAAIPSTELLTNLDDHILAEKQYLLVSFSRSGESSEGIALLQLALDRYPKQIRHLLITCNESGSMAKFPGIFTITLDDVVNDRGLAMTSSFSNMVLTGQYLASIHDTGEYEAAVRKMAAIGDVLLPVAANMAAELAPKAFQRVCLLGTGALQATAQESSLKVLELNGGKLPTLAESFLGLRHGPMSFLNKETLVIAFLSNDEDRLPYELDLLEEIREKKLAGEILVVAPRLNDRIQKLTKYLLTLDTPRRFPDAYLPVVDIIVGQLLALFFAIENGITPDTPSDGAISRVVSHVKIYSPAGRTEK